MSETAWVVGGLGLALGVALGAGLMAWRHWGQPPLRLAVMAQRVMTSKGRSLLVNAHVSLYNPGPTPRLVDGLELEVFTPGAEARLVAPGWDDPDRMSLVRDGVRGVVRWSTARENVLRFPLPLPGRTRVAGAVILNVHTAPSGRPVGVLLRAVAQGRTVGTVTMSAGTPAASTAVGGDPNR